MEKSMPHRAMYLVKLGGNMRKKEFTLLVSVDIKRSMCSWKYLLIILLIPAVMIGCVHDSIIDGIRYNLPREAMSSLELLLMALVFDRFKPIMVVLLSLIYTSAVSDDISSAYLRFCASRCNVTSYMLAKICVNAIAITAATVIGFLLFIILLYPVMGMKNMSTPYIYGFELTSGGDFPWLYAVAVGILFSSFAIMLTTFSIWISIYHPSRYVAIAIPFVLFYLLYALTTFLPLQFNMWYLSSGVINLPQTIPSIVRYLYALAFFLIPSAVFSIAGVKAMRRRFRDGIL